MAKLYTPLVLAGLLALVGCQSPAQQASVAQNLPAPNFSGPNLQEPGYGPRAQATLPPVAPTPAPPARAVVPAPRSTARADVPSAWVPYAAPHHWKWIVIHHSATPTGGAVAFDRMHRAKGWDELGYHFVIGNGTDTHDGRVEVGSRWPKQKWGAHAKTPSEQFNRDGIGICLVGNFDVTHPTSAQIKSLTKLVSYLMYTYHIPADHVLGHRDTKSTDCPGRYMNVALVRRQAVRMLAQAGETIPPDTRASALARGGELLMDDSRKKTR
ncbi:MAG TPA: peptidoglycan recognition family protein [Tepidisphaeraceae bacterium]|nr:peptidoglycan recognition family protein [Tepidisphaeraceae bacterium]